MWFYLPNLPEFSADLEFLDSDPRIKLAKTVADIRANKQAGKVSMVIGWQNSAALEEGPGNDWRNSRPPRTKLREYYELGLRVANLSYSLSNQFGGGMLDPNAPLTTQGKFIVSEMQDMGILVDCCGHTSEQTALDIIAMARRPVVITHGNVLALNDNPRNSSDRVIEGVAKTGGLMGVTALDAFMTWSRKDAARVDTGPYPPQATVARYVDEFDYLKRLIGIDHIALRTDFTSYIEAADPSQLFQFPPEMMYKQTPTIKYVDGFASVSDLKNARAKWYVVAIRRRRSRRFLVATGCACSAKPGTRDFRDVTAGGSHNDQESCYAGCARLRARDWQAPLGRERHPHN